MDLAVQELDNMKRITLKSNVNWCKHILCSLTPLKPELHPDEEVFMFITDHHFEIIWDEVKRIPSKIIFAYGPTLQVGEINEQIGMPLKEISSAFDKDGEYLYPVLIFSNDISSNESTGDNS